MSKLDIGVGSEFPLDESQPGDDRHAWKEENRGRRQAWRRHRHAHHHHGHGHHHHHRGLLHLPLIAAVAGIAALIGAGRIPHLATEIIVGLAVLLVVLGLALHARHHRSWHRGQEAR